MTTPEYPADCADDCDCRDCLEADDYRLVLLQAEEDTQPLTTPPEPEGDPRR